MKNVPTTTSKNHGTYSSHNENHIDGRRATYTESVNLQSYRNALVNQGKKDMATQTDQPDLFKIIKKVMLEILDLNLHEVQKENREGIIDKAIEKTRDHYENKKRGRDSTSPVSSDESEYDSSDDSKSNSILSDNTEDIRLKGKNVKSGRNSRKKKNGKKKKRTSILKQDVSNRK